MGVKNNLVVVNTSIMNAEEHMREIDDIKDLKLENQVLIGDMLYIASFSKIIYEATGFDGTWGMECLQELKEQSNNQQETEMKVTANLFKKMFGNNKDKKDVFMPISEYQGKKYLKKWDIKMNDDITYYGKSVSGFEFGHFKRMIAEKGIIVSNELMENFFGPLIAPLLNIFNTIDKF